MDEMNPKLMKLIEKKKKEGKSMSPAHKRASSDVLKHLMSEMDDMGAESLQGAKKVSVISDSKKGLEEGLEKAKELVEEKLPSEEEMSKEEEPSEEMEEEGEESEEEEMEEESPEALKKKIEELKAKLQKLEG